MKTIKTIIVLLAAALLAWALPWCYAFVCSEPQESPLTLYSCVTHDFATFSFEGHDDAAGYDPAGNPYTERQFDSIMPTVFTRRLAEEGRLPERIDGIPFDAREVELSNFVFRASPSELNRPQIGLYQLLESAPGREGFRTPDDVFRITERGIEFVKMADNRIDAEKSERFDRVMKKKGFVFPARRIAGSASTYKHYDNGYLLLDATGTPFQMKQLCGRPFVRRIERPDSVTFTYAFVTEFPDKRLLGFLGDDRGGIHALEADYSLHCLPLHPVDLRRERLIVVGDCFYWTAITERQGFECPRLFPCCGARNRFPRSEMGTDPKIPFPVSAGLHRVVRQIHQAAVTRLLVPGPRTEHPAGCRLGRIQHEKAALPDDPRIGDSGAWDLPVGPAAAHRPRMNGRSARHGHFCIHPMNRPQTRFRPIQGGIFVCPRQIRIHGHL